MPTWQSQRKSICGLDPQYNNNTGGFGAWTHASSQTHGRLTGALIEKNSHFTTSAELANDVIGQSLSFRMTSGVYNHIELLRYCMPDQGILDGGRNSGVNDWRGGTERWRYIWMAGARFEGLADTDDNPRLLALRRRVRALLYPAQVKDTVGLGLSSAGTPRPSPSSPPGLSAMSLVSGGMKWGGTAQSFAKAGVEAAVVNGPHAMWFLLAEPKQAAWVRRQSREWSEPMIAMKA